MPRTIFKKGNVTLKKIKGIEADMYFLKVDREVLNLYREELPRITHVLNAYLKEQGKK